MASAKVAASTVTCAENVSLLHLLQPKPALPTRNTIHDKHIRLKGYVLSFERERSLTGVLAFLSSTTDDRNLITAVAVQERHKSNSLDVLLAVNKSNPKSGIATLKELKRAFETIFATLNQITDGQSSVQLCHLLH